MIAGDIQIANNSGGAVASAVVGGANLVITGCYINTLPYELVVHESIKSAEDLRGKSVGISRVGSASDVGGAGTGQGTWIGTGEGCADHASRRHRRARGGVSRRAGSSAFRRRRDTFTWLKACPIVS